MLKYNCIIVEDEPLAIEILKDYINLVPTLNLKAVCTDAIQALKILKRHKIDLIFLDIHLPELKGLDFLQTLTWCPPVIITSAYHQYALTSYEYNVVDYLLKPFEFSRFIKAVNKFDSQLKQADTEIPVPAGKKYLLVTIDKKKVKILTDEIFHIESLREYVKIVTTTETYKTKLKIGQINDWLVNEGFLRVHRSFIVSKDKITTFTATYVKVKETQIPIGRNYKTTVLQALEDGQVK